jgi:hypothetical protein
VCHPGAISESAYAVAVWADRVDRVVETCSALTDHPESHVQFTLLRSCLSASKVTDLLRASPFQQAPGECARLSQTLRDTFGSIQGSPVTDLQWAQVTLPIRCGGLGIGDPSVIRLPARMAGILDYGRRSCSTLGLLPSLCSLPGDWPQVLLRAAGPLGQVQPVQAWLHNPAAVVPQIDPTHGRQSWWADLMYKSIHTKLQGALSGADSVRFACQSLPHAMAWAAVTPAVAKGTLISAGDFRNLLRFHLGVKLFSPPLDAPSLPAYALPRCPRCSVSMDEAGHHLVCCHKNGITQRHGMVEDALFRLVTRSGY